MRDFLWTRPERRLATLVTLGAVAALLAALLMALAQGGAARAQAAPPEQPFIPAELVLDHFTCYDAAEQTPTAFPVVLVDQFGVVITNTVQVSEFCTPATKFRPDTGEVRGERFPFAHLTCYDLEAAPTLDRTVHVEHQFGAQDFTLNATTVEGSLELCTPTRKLTVDGTPQPDAPVPPETVLDHYLCYEFNDPKPQLTLPPLELGDEFGISTPVQPGGGTENFCNPVKKTRLDVPETQPIKYPFAHLTCQEILAFAPEHLITTQDQFGPHTIDVQQPDSVCAPTMKAGAPPPPPELVLGHFKCYQVTGKVDKVTVGLSDQFGTTQAQVKKVDSLCNPVKKRFEDVTTPIRDRTAHLECLDIKDAKDKDLARTVEVTNQFGTERLQVQKPATLCAPSSKSETATPPGPIPSRLDHFKCYDVKGEQLVKRSVLLSDQFGIEDVTAMHAQLLCNPVEKRIGHEVVTPQFPFAHLVCYQITPRDFKGKLDVTVRNQFGLRELRVVGPRTLCLPSTKTDVP